MSVLQRYCLVLCLGMLQMIATSTAEALEATITAQYLGDASGRFENTTPPAIFCQRWPQKCTEFTVVDLPITYVKAATAGESEPRDRFYLKLPARRQVDIIHEQTGELHSLSFDFTAVSQYVGGPLPRWNPAYSSPRGDCTILTSFSQGPSPIRFLWAINTPPSPAACYSMINRPPADYHEVVTVPEMGVAYKLTLPTPYRLKPGIYRGSVTYTIGPGGDFDFGNNVTQLNGNSLTLNFVLDIQHLFFFNFPPGSDRAVLEPPGGWLAWLNGGRVPQRIYRDLPFRLWSTGPFKVYKLCQYQAGTHCGIRNDGNDEVPVQVGLTLPGGIRHQNAPVERLTLPTGRASALHFEAVQATVNRPGQLHFEVGKDDVRGMLAHAGSTYTGQVTVVFDAEL